MAKLDWQSLSDELRRRIQDGEESVAQQLLQAHPEIAADEELAVELVYREFVQRAELGSAPAMDDFLNGHPQYADRLRRVLSIHEIFEGTAPALVNTHASNSTHPGVQGTTATHNRSTIFGEKYWIECELGRGSSGVVYQAKDLSLDRWVALKVLYPQYDSGAMRDKVFDEARTVARMRHPNIVQIYEVGEHDKQLFLALEFTEGGRLSDRLESGRYPVGEAVAICETLARALDACHRHGIIHRDLKPANVLLSADGEVKITDFGLALLLENMTDSNRSMSLAGTPLYMAPEQVAGRHDDIGPATDIHALGCLLYELLVGRTPFPNGDQAGLLEQILNQPPLPPRRLQPGLSRDLQSICLCCLEKDPRDRYDSALEFAEDLQRWQTGQPICARHISVVERGWRKLKKRPWAVVGCTAILIALTALSAVARWEGTKADTAQTQLADLAEQLTTADVLALRVRMQELVERPHSLNNRLKAAQQIRQAANTTAVADSLSEDLREALWREAGSVFYQMGHWQAADESFRAAWKLWLNKPTADSAANESRAVAAEQWIDVLWQLGRLEQAQQQSREALDYFGARLKHRGLAYATLHQQAGKIDANCADWMSAQQHYQAAIAAMRPADNPATDQAATRRQMRPDLLYGHRSDHTRQMNALLVNPQLPAANPADPRALWRTAFFVSLWFNSIAARQATMLTESTMLSLAQGDRDTALEKVAQIQALPKHHWRADQTRRHGWTTRAMSFANFWHQWAVLQLQLNQPDQARPCLDQAIEIVDLLTAEFPEHFHYRALATEIHLTAYEHYPHDPQREVQLNKVYRHVTSMLANSHPVPESLRIRAARVYGLSGDEFERRQQLDDAIEARLRAIQQWRILLGQNSDSVDRSRVETDLDSLIRLLDARQQPEQVAVARQLKREVLKAFE